MNFFLKIPVGKDPGNLQVHPCSALVCECVQCATISGIQVHSPFLIIFCILLGYRFFHSVACGIHIENMYHSYLSIQLRHLKLIKTNKNLICYLISIVILSRSHTNFISSSTLWWGNEDVSPADAHVEHAQFFEFLHCIEQEMEYRWCISKKVSTIHSVVGIARQYRYSNGLLCLTKYSIAMYIWRVILGIKMQPELFFEDQIDVRNLVRLVMC